MGSEKHSQVGPVEFENVMTWHKVLATEAETRMWLEHLMTRLGVDRTFGQVPEGQWGYIRRQVQHLAHLRHLLEYVHKQEGAFAWEDSFRVLLEDCVCSIVAEDLRR
jgi:hypothetical protein